MEITIGLRQAQRELTIKSPPDQDQIRAKVATAIEQGSGLLELADQNGDTHLIPVRAIAYVTIGNSAPRRVGFGS
ncbi:MAG: DUF3107 domain-containing protein [Micrococcales bacterium]|nr:DUF3107 domain-containing protein [Micrococcales bacterium]